MQKEFVPYELAVKLKELGFECDYSFKEYDTKGYLQQTGLLSSHDLPHVDAPLWQQAFDWFREKFNLDSYFSQITPLKWTFQIRYILQTDTVEEWESYKFFVDFVDTKEEALEGLLSKLIEIVVNKNLIKNS